MHDLHRRRARGRLRWSAAAVALAAVAAASAQASDGAAPACDPDDAGLRLPPGFCALVFVEGLAKPRHLVVTDNGDVLAALGRPSDSTGGVVLVRDTDGDGRGDLRSSFGGPGPATGISLDRGHLYLAYADRVVRWRWKSEEVSPSSDPEVVVSGLLAERSHSAKTIAFSPDGGLFVGIGAPSNACQEPDRSIETPGRRPCPLLAASGGIWRFDPTRAGQTQSDGRRFASGLRNAMAIAVEPTTGVLYGATHGRDGLDTLWPKLFSAAQNAEHPAEELYRIDDGDVFGWPYCYYDLSRRALLANPEYGGDGRSTEGCEAFETPAVALPAHWAPLAMTFYRADAFPEKYRGGAFVAFHGSWNRAPLPQAGYNVVFVPFADGRPVGSYEEFATGFAGPTPTPRGPHRPSGVAVGPDGSLYVADDAGGRIYRIVYRGSGRARSVGRPGAPEREQPKY